MDTRMKKNIIGLICVATFLLGSATAINYNSIEGDERIQSCDGEWNKKYEGRGYAGFYDVRSSQDGGFVLVGTTSKDRFKYDAWITKMDIGGNIVWSNSFGGKEEDKALSVVDVDDGYVLGGITKSFGAGNYDFWLIKVDDAGNEIWNQTYGKEHIDYLRALVATSDGGYAMVGETHSFNSLGDPDVLVIKTDGNGNVEWRKVFGGNKTDSGDDITETENGYLISGITYSYTSNGGWDTWLIQIDEQGHELWNKTYGWWGFEFNAHVDDAKNGHLIAGYTISTSTGWGDAYMLKVDKEGNEQWKKKYGGPDSEHVLDFEATNDGYVLVGRTGTQNVGQFDAWLLKVGHDGTELWNKTFGGRSSDEAQSVISLNGYYVWAGNTNKVISIILDKIVDVGWLVKCKDDNPARLKIIEPQENHIYLFGRQIMPYDETVVIGGITVVAETSETSEIDRAEFYINGWQSYEYRPRKIVQQPPYEWECRKLGFGQPIRVTVAGYYGEAEAVAVDDIRMRIVNFSPLSIQT
jgi:hypothetical protein